MAKQSLFEAVASAMSKSNHAKADLRNLDERAYRMQGSAKTWAKNADKFNEKANALLSKEAWNDYVANKLKWEGTERVNAANRVKANDLKNKIDAAKTFNELMEQADYGNIRQNGYTQTISDAGVIERMRKLGAKGTDDEILEGYLGDYAPQINPSDDPRGFLKDTDVFDDPAWGREEYRDAAETYNNILINSPYKSWYDATHPYNSWRKMGELQNASPRYRK